MWRLIMTFLLRFGVYQAATAHTCDYFWREAVGDAKGPGKSPQDVYQEALEATKQYMHGAVPWGVPPEWLR